MLNRVTIPDTLTVPDATQARSPLLASTLYALGPSLPMLANPSFYQSAATAFLALLGVGIFAESREPTPSEKVRLRKTRTGHLSPSKSARTGKPRRHIRRAVHSDAGPRGRTWNRLLPRKSLARKIARESGSTLLLGGTFALGEILCLIVLANNTAHGWQLGLISYSLILGLIVTIGGAFGAVLRWRVPELPRRTRRRLQVAVVAILSVVAMILLVLNTINEGRGFGSFNLPQATLPADYFFIHGTCADGKCGLTERAAPRPSGRRTGRIWLDNELAHVICQVQGGLFMDAHGSRSAIWDKLADDGYVTDVFVKTPGKGTFSQSIKRCATTGKVSG